jgi:hypothetical protein
MTLAGVPDSLGFMAPFLVLTALNLVAGVVLLRNIQEITLKPQVVSLPQARTAAV